MSGPLAGLFGALLGEMSARNEYSIFIDDAKRERILHGLFDSYYADSTAQVIFDTNRAWCAWMAAIAKLFPDAKVIACVRDLAWVVDSIERLVERNVFSPSSIFNDSPGRHGLHPANGVVGPDGMVGAPDDALKQACYGAQRERLLLVQYETLTTDPAKTMHAIYEFLGEPAVRARFRRHRLRRHSSSTSVPVLRGCTPCAVKSRPIRATTLLPPDLFNRFVNDAFWRDPQKIPTGLRVV